MAYIGNQPTTVAFLTDSFSGNGSTTAFTLSAAPANTNSILVAVSGVLQDPTTYAVSGTTLTFSAAPPSGTGNISVRFLGIPASGVVTTAYRTQTEFTATAGQTTFSVPSYTPGFIDVYRNGVMLGSANYTASNGTTVVLGNAASAGDLVEVISFSVSSVLNAIPATNGAVTSAYLLNGSVTQAKLGTGVAGTGPTFSAYLSSGNQSITSGVNTVAVLNTEEWDVGGCFNNTGSTVTLNGLSVPAYAFCPNVAGYYQVSANLRYVSVGNFTAVVANFNLNGGIYYRWFELTNGSYSVGWSSSGSMLIYLNGAGDYVQLAGQITGTNPQFDNAGSQYTSRMQAVLVRSA